MTKRRSTKRAAAKKKRGGTISAWMANPAASHRVRTAGSGRAKKLQPSDRQLALPTSAPRVQRRSTRAGRGVSGAGFGLRRRQGHAAISSGEVYGPSEWTGEGHGPEHGPARGPGRNRAVARKRAQRRTGGRIIRKRRAPAAATSAATPARKAAAKRATTAKTKATKAAAVATSAAVAAQDAATPKTAKKRATKARAAAKTAVAAATVATKAAKTAKTAPAKKAATAAKKAASKAVAAATVATKAAATPASYKGLRKGGMTLDALLAERDAKSAKKKSSAKKSSAKKKTAPSTALAKTSSTGVRRTSKRSRKLTKKPKGWGSIPVRGILFAPKGARTMRNPSVPTVLKESAKVIGGATAGAAASYAMGQASQRIENPYLQLAALAVGGMAGIGASMAIGLPAAATAVGMLTGGQLFGIGQNIMAQRKFAAQSGVAGVLRRPGVAGVMPRVGDLPSEINREDARRQRELYGSDGRVAGLFQNQIAMRARG